MNFPRLFRTVRYLKPIQIVGRAWFRFYKPPLDTVASPALRTVAGHWQAPITKSPSMLAADTFCFLGQTGTLADARSWNDPAHEKLWLYNLHYFDDLTAADAFSRHGWHVALMQRWVKENPPTTGNGWEPYPTSLRIVNWVKWAMAGNTLPDDCLASLVLQTRWLSQRMEWHLLGNHLFANAKALVFAGLFLQGREADGWLQKGLKIIRNQLPEQVLPDGGNFELSTMYHAIFLEDVLDLVNITTTIGPSIDSDLPTPLWQATALSMLGWLQTMLHPDGEIGLFNDAAIGIAPSFNILQAYALCLGVPSPTRLTLPLHHLRDSGYVRLSQPSAVALLDVAPIGPDYLPGHAHADTLSFELSIFGQRLVVNGGTSRYGLGPERLRERETAWHSTVEVAGLSSSEVWGGFRVGRRAYPFGLSTSTDHDTLVVNCSHDGYRFLPGKPVHSRTWQMDEHGITITDSVSSTTLPSMARFIFHPEITIEPVDSSHWRLCLANGQHISLYVGHGSATIADAWYAPAFGQLIFTHCLLVTFTDGKAITSLQWS